MIIVLMAEDFYIAHPKDFSGLTECYTMHISLVCGSLIETHKQLFNTSPGRTTVTEHFIPTMGNPVKIPPCRVPVHYRAKVQQ